MKNKILYLMEMANNNNLTGDIKARRVRTVENVPIEYDGEPLEMFFEFGLWERYTYRMNNKRTGAPLKHPIRELLNPNGLHVDTQFERQEVDRWSGRTWSMSHRHLKIEEEITALNMNYTRADILDAVNMYSDDNYIKIVLIEEEAERIAREIGGYREKSIINGAHYFKEGARFGNTWNESHKVVEVVSKELDTCGDSFEVDLVTGIICG